MHRETKKAPDVQVIQEGGDDRVSGTDADRHDDISHNGSSEFGGNPDSADTAELVAPCKSLVGALASTNKYLAQINKSLLALSKNALCIGGIGDHYNRKLGE